MLKKLIFVFLCFGVFAENFGNNCSENGSKICPGKSEKTEKNGIDFFVEDSFKIDFDESTFSSEMAVFSNKSGVFLYDKKGGIRKILDEKVLLASKVFLGSDRVFINTASGVFKAIDFNGKLIFSVELDGVSRSDIVCDPKNGNVFFSTIDQAVFCFSKDGKLLWKNTEFLVQNNVLNSNLIISDFLGFYNTLGVSLIEKLTGASIPGKISHIFLQGEKFISGYNSGEKLCLISEKQNYYFEKSSGNFEKFDKNEFFVNGKKFTFPVFVCEGNTKIDFKNSRHFGKFSVFFDGKYFAIIMENQEKISYKKFDFEIKDVFFSGENLFIFTGNSIKVVKIVK